MRTLDLEYRAPVDPDRTVSVHLDAEGRPERVPDEWRERLSPYSADPSS